MKDGELKTASVNTETLQMLRRAEAAINQHLGLYTNPHERIFLLAFK